MRRNANPVVLPGNDQPTGAFISRYRNRTDLLAVPDGILKEIVKDLVKDRVCEDLNMRQICVTAKSGGTCNRDMTWSSLCHWGS